MTTLTTSSVADGTEWPQPDIPTDHPRRPGNPDITARREAELPAEVHDAFASHGPIDEVCTAAFVALLHRYSGQRQFTLAAPGGALRVDVTDGITFTGLRQQVASSWSADIPTTTRAAFLGVAADPAFTGPAGQELALAVSRTPHRSTIHLWYAPQLYDPDTADRMLGHYRTLLAAALARPDVPIARLPLLTFVERQRMLVDWNDTATDLPHDRCLHELFQCATAEHPDAVAARQQDRAWTYAEINAGANRLARHLTSRGVRPGTVVGIRLPRSPQLLIAVLAVLKAGAAYLPLDPSYPPRRLAAMSSDAGCVHQITTAGALRLPTLAGQETVLVDEHADIIAGHPADDLPPSATPEDLCYVIYTSGSTGKPKGIALRHRGVVNNLTDLNSRFAITAGDSVLQLSSFSFDMSVYELLGITIAGGTVVFPETGRDRDTAHWNALAERHRITVWNSAPALLEAFVDHVGTDGGTLHHLRVAMLGGDWVPIGLPDRARAVAPGLRFVVLGGATESSVHSTIYEVGKVDDRWTSIPYGRPMANQRTYILDPAGQPVPVGVPGELHLAGIGLARGYLHRPDLTRERFFDWGYGPVSRDRLYRTGDLARYRADGQVELLGRLDFQVKLRGLRVELGEIEAILRADSTVREAVVVTADAGSGRRLVGFVTAAGAREPDPAVLLEGLRARLPAHMVPDAVRTLGELPLSPNGKVDRRALTALPAPDPNSSSAVPGTPPQGATERLVAEVFSDVLGTPVPDREANFFALGGDSLGAVRAGARLRPSPRLVDFLRAPTVAAVARLIDELAADPESSTRR